MAFFKNVFPVLISLWQRAKGPVTIYRLGGAEDFLGGDQMVI